MKAIIIILFTASTILARERIKLTTYARKYIGRSTASRERYSGGYTAATNRMKYYLHEVRVWKNGKCVDVRINDKFSRAKFGVLFVKFDLSAKAMKKLGLSGWAWA